MMCRSLSTIVLTTAIALAVEARAERLPIEGAYGSLSGCEAHAQGAQVLIGPDDRPWFLLSGNRLAGLEWECQIEDSSSASRIAWRLDLNCSSEGTTWSEVATLTVDTGSATVSVVFEDGGNATADLCSLPYAERLQREVRRLAE